MARHQYARNYIETVLRDIGKPAPWPQIKEAWFDFHPKSYLRVCPTAAQVGSMLDRDPRFEIFGHIVLNGVGINRDARSQYNLWGLTEWHDNLPPQPLE